MRTYLPAAVLSGALLCGASFAQSPSTPPSQPEPQAASPATTPQTQTSQPQTQPQTAQPSASSASGANQKMTPSRSRIAPGSVIPVQLTKTIDAKKAKPGDQIVAKVTMDLKTTSGEVLVPKDTKVTGHVTEAQARKKDQKESQLGIAFDRASLKNGDMALPMSIQAVIAPPSNNANGGSDEGAPAASGGSPAPTPSGGSRGGAMGGSAPTPQPSASPSPDAEGTEGQQQSGARPPINGNTQGVVGISNLKLEPAANTAQGSVLSSEKNNVKMESGTMLLLKVNP